VIENEVHNLWTGRIRRRLDYLLSNLSMGFLDRFLVYHASLRNQVPVL
jgi:hypothetical protein